MVRGLAEGASVIVSSHILSEISQTCDRILVLHDGKLVAQGTEGELVSRGGGDRRLVITVRGEAEPFERWLTQHAMVERTDRREASAGQARFLVELSQDDRETFLAQLVEHGFGLRLVEAPEDELEEIFLSLTGQEAAA